jgi:hypothetical protein
MRGGSVNDQLAPFGAPAGLGSSYSNVPPGEAALVTATAVGGGMLGGFLGLLCGFPKAGTVAGAAAGAATGVWLLQ